MLEERYRFWRQMYLLEKAATFLEFWTFIVLREEHIIMWSWWWLVALQAGSFLGMLNSYTKWKKGEQ